MSSTPRRPGGSRSNSTPEPGPTKLREFPIRARLRCPRPSFPWLAVVLVSSLLFAAVTAPVEAQIPVTPILPPTPTPASLRQGLTPLVFPLPSPTPQLSLLSIQDATIREPVRGTSNLLFTVVLTPVAAQDVRVSFITRGVGSAQGPLPGPLPSSACGTADGADYRFTSGALTIPAGQSSRTIPITICSDGRVEGPETFAVDLLNMVSGNARIARGTAVGTILDALITVDAGTFDLSPEQATVGVGEPITYSFGWTVPEDRVWRDLRTLDLRLRPDGDAQTLGIWVRWEETGDTFSLCQATDVQAGDEPSSGQCGAGIPAGSAGTLESEGATLFLTDTVAGGTGPTGPTVTLTVPVSLPEAGCYLVEVAGDDDDGNRDGFFVVGNLQVGEPSCQA